MKALCISNNLIGLTYNTKYDIIENKHETYLLLNDFGEKIWYYRNKMGIIEVLSLTGVFIKYIGNPREGMTIGNYYEIVDNYDRDYYYFINDNNKFVGINKINYCGGRPNFTELQKNLQVDLENQ